MISKVLSNQFNNLLPDLISSYQNAHDTNDRYFEYQGYLLTIDIEKACDFVYHVTRLTFDLFFKKNMAVRKAFKDGLKLC